ncbi:23S rRNA (adenine(2503)-C(2))-methyltransferase RlmN [bacterium]|nr:23S rRNA (adenine(2503)-C(2))-methyltransferase RlmN [bacterium]
MINRLDLKGLDRGQLREFVESLGEKPYRATQIFKWIYGHGIDTFDEMTNVSKHFRLVLSNRAEIGRLTLVDYKTSSIGDSTKFLFKLRDGLQIESVLMFDGGRTTLCVSTQVGCAIDCKFCATGRMGLKRNLTVGEIIDQLLTAQLLSSEKVSNVVCMGMGEPFHNYTNVMKACTLMCDDLGPNLATRHIVVSTSGIAPKIVKFADEGRKFRLAVSLNAVTDSLRDKIMPLNKRWPIQELLQAVRYYCNRSGQSVTFEYVMLGQINDRLEDAVKLRELLRGLKCKVNLIPYNATDGRYRRPTQERIQRFYSELSSLHAPVTIRWSKGEDIDAACGQLAVSN